MKKPTDLLVRRGFLKKAGLGSVSIASAMALAGHLTTPTQAKAQSLDGSGIFNWIFAAFSAAGTVGTVAHRAAMEGHGFTDGSQVAGVGSYNLFDNASAVPKTILSGGTWEATSLNSFRPVGSWGALESAIVDMQINLLQIIPSEDVIAARLVVPCNIPNAGLFTGTEEGFFLTIPGAPEGTYSPLSPPIGGSVFMLFEGGDDL